MWIRIRVVIVEDEPLAAEYLAWLRPRSIAPCMDERINSPTSSQGWRLVPGASLRQSEVVKTLCEEIRFFIWSAAV
jgi:hypothetical protein